MASLVGKVVAMICRGSNADRAIAVALAEAGADVALGTVTRAQTEEFSTASIANELWAIGREQFNTVLDAADPAQAASFAEEVCDRLRRCDALVVACGPTAAVEFDELSADEWELMLRGGLTAALVSAQAVSRVMERGGGGLVALVTEEAADSNLAGRVLRVATEGLAEALNANWRERPLVSHLVARADGPEEVLQLLT
jgi:7-alpha-hydroxysteroid dehydrogenase